MEIFSWIYVYFIFIIIKLILLYLHWNIVVTRIQIVTKSQKKQGSVSVYTATLHCFENWDKIEYLCFSEQIHIIISYLSLKLIRAYGHLLHIANHLCSSEQWCRWWNQTNVFEPVDTFISKFDRCWTCTWSYWDYWICNNMPTVDCKKSISWILVLLCFP